MRKSAYSSLVTSYLPIANLSFPAAPDEPLFMKLEKSDSFTRIISGQSLQLTKLTTLWLARNQIAFICDALDNNLALTDLNLSANLVGNFKDIPHLSRLRHLKSLSFGDPHYGECPVCALCNYQTYVLFHVHHLSTLDSLRLTDEARQLAEATYMKKKMYYNMRIKTLKRNTSNVIRKAMEARQTKVSQINLNLNVLLRQAKDVERAIPRGDIVGGGRRRG